MTSVIHLSARFITFAIFFLLFINITASRIARRSNDIGIHGRVTLTHPTFLTWPERACKTRRAQANSLFRRVLRARARKRIFPLSPSFDKLRILSREFLMRQRPVINLLQRAGRTIRRASFVMCLISQLEKYDRIRLMCIHIKLHIISLRFNLHVPRVEFTK